MRKVILMVMLLTFCFSMSALAYAPTTAQEILNNPLDDQRVILEGQFVERIRHEHYYFADSTARINVEVDDDRYFDSDIKMGVPVRIYAKVDFEGNKHGKRVELEIKKIEYL